LFVEGRALPACRDSAPDRRRQVQGTAANVPAVPAGHRDCRLRRDTPAPPASQGEPMKLQAILQAGLTAVALAAAAGCSSTASVTGAERPGASTAEGRKSIDAGYHETLERLYATTPGSRELVAKARGVLIFPRVIAAGLVVGGAYGEGELRTGGELEGYYRTTTGSVGWQIGAQSRALVFLFMTQDALDRFRASKGWSGGVDASVAVLKVGANGAIDANAERAPTVAFVMTNAGLMADLTLQGTKVTRID
jgi:lipid-binding SYLF domain-containing protein